MAIQSGVADSEIDSFNHLMHNVPKWSDKL